MVEALESDEQEIGPLCTPHPVKGGRGSSLGNARIQQQRLSKIRIWEIEDFKSL